MTALNKAPTDRRAIVPDDRAPALFPGKDSRLLQQIRATPHGERILILPRQNGCINRPMTTFVELIEQLFSLLTTRTHAFTAAWNGFENFPDVLPRKAYARFVREIAELETMLRRLIYWDALRLRRAALAKPEKPAPARSAPVPTAPDAPAETPSERPRRLPVLRLDERPPAPASRFIARAFSLSIRSWRRLRRSQNLNCARPPR